MLRFVPFDHGVCASLRHEEESIDVDREGPLEILVRGCQEGFVGYNAGGVDVDVDSTEVLDDLRDRIDNLVADSDVNNVVLDFDIVL